MTWRFSGDSGRIERVAVLRALKLGDLLCTVPALRALRHALPEADIRLVGLPWSRELVDRFDGYLDGLFELPGFPGFPEVPFDARAFARFLGEVHAWGPDLVLQLHGSGDLSNPLALLLGGRHVAGYYLPGQYCPDPASFIPYPDDVPEVRRPLRLLEHLGIGARGLHKELPIRPADRVRLAALLADGGLARAAPTDAGPADGAPADAEPDQAATLGTAWLAGHATMSGYVVVHPGASVPERRWPPERFAAVADALAGQGLAVVLTGSAVEAPITAAVAAQMRRPSIDLAGRTGLGTLAALLSDAALLVSNDTGVMHVAEGVDTPLVAVSFDPESWRWAPLDVGRFRIVLGGYAVTAEDLLGAATALLCSRPGESERRADFAGQTPDARDVADGGA